MTGKKYRLPTEAEWEYAARGGRNYKYAGSNDLKSVAWYENNSRGKTHPVGQLLPNGYGLYDMSGNVWEWCEDYTHESYEGIPIDGSAWTIDGNNDRRVLRGSSWYFGDWGCQLSDRGGDYFVNRIGRYGFRCSRSN